MIKINDYVILIKKHQYLELHSVGIVKSISKKNIVEVFFIGKSINLFLKRSDLKYLDVAKTGKPHKYKICNVCHVLKKIMLILKLIKLMRKEEKQQDLAVNLAE